MPSLFRVNDLQLKRLATSLVVTAFAFAATSAHADLILQPVGASTTMGTVNPTSGSLDMTYDQSGLSTPYISNVTDFDAYIGGNPTHELAVNPSNAWTSATDPTYPGVVDFDLGGTFFVESLALWNLGGGFDFNLREFRLLADDNAAFSSPVTLGTFDASPSGSSVAAPVQTFDFASTSASFVRLEILSNQGTIGGATGSTNVGFGEVAFNVTSVPEPSSMALVGVGIGLVGLRRRRVAQ